MIIYYLLQLFTFIGEQLTGLFGRVDVLPFGTDTPISQFWGWFMYIVDDVWPLEAILNVIIIYLGWRISVKLYQKIFGSRAVIN